MFCYVNWCLVLYYTASGGSSSAFLAMFFHLGRVGTARRTPPAAAALFAPLGFEHRASKVGLPHSFSAPAALWFAWAFAMAMPLGPDGQNHVTECKTLAENMARVAAAGLCARSR